MEQIFSKKIFTARLFLSDLGYLILHLPTIIKIFVLNRKPEHLIEKIVMVTDAVNGCIYCSWMDAKLAMRSGVSEDEIRNLLKLEFYTDASPYELNALLYAQHYAETNRRPDPEMTKDLFDSYGEKIANDILVAIRMVTFGNLYFNTWLAVISRFKGKPAPDSNVVFELAYFLFNSVIIVPFVILRKLDKKAIGLV